MSTGTVSPATASFQADVIRAVGHPLRIKIISYIGGGQRQVADIIQFFDSDPSNISRHLAILKRAGVLSSRKRGLNVFYCVDMACVPVFLDALGQAISRKVTH